MHHQVFMSIDLNVIEFPGPATRNEIDAPGVLVGFVSNERAILVLGRLATTDKQSNGKCQYNSNLVHRIFLSYAIGQGSNAGTGLRLNIVLLTLLSILGIEFGSIGPVRK